MRHAVGYLQALRRSNANLARSLPRLGRRLQVACGELHFGLPRERCAEPLVKEEDVGLGRVEVDPAWPGPGTAYPTCYLEAVQRGFYEQWNKLMVKD